MYRYAATCVSSSTSPDGPWRRRHFVRATKNVVSSSGGSNHPGTHGVLHADSAGSGSARHVTLFSVRSVDPDLSGLAVWQHGSESCQTAEVGRGSQRSLFRNNRHRCCYPLCLISLPLPLHWQSSARASTPLPPPPRLRARVPEPDHGAGRKTMSSAAPTSVKLIGASNVLFCEYVCSVG